METFNGEFKETDNKALMGEKSVTEKLTGTVKNTARGLSDHSDGVKAGEREEGAITKQIEAMTSKIPSATFLSLAIGSIGLSLLLRMFGLSEDALFIGQWVPTILILGLYNKLVKLEGSDKLDRRSSARV